MSGAIETSNVSIPREAAAQIAFFICPTSQFNSFFFIPEKRTGQPSHHTTVMRTEEFAPTR